MGVRPEKELRQPTDAAVAAAAGENDDRSFPAGEARVGEGSAARSDDMLQGDTEIAGEGVAVAKAAMASDGERRREAEEGERLRLERWWRVATPLGFESDNVLLCRLGSVLMGRAENVHCST
ncbi:Os03g0815332 [Oryza sativa Japonica Group]|uniref:Uncharacterized protein n=2 Tax=Oryza sativa subsp. japonica TaxID=39947 RepID=A0A8J8XNV6_ORYSJ|nr:hypothetical protein OsJ_13094 [Oryza sativa Japonica Group]KAB8094164.1 hypothetical protein EE612_021258 [Oryza sativa]BAS87033.1 Os03g0815332 [Oryza sativa Japonica Group]